MAAIAARITRSILEHCGDIVHALVTGAAAEPDLDAVLAEGQRRHVEGARRVVGMLGRTRRPRARAWTPTTRPTRSPPCPTSGSRLVLRESYGWSLDRIERWITTTSRTLVLGSGARAGERDVRDPGG